MNASHILVIDDEKHLRNMLFLMLKAEGHRCTTADCGEKGLALLEEEEFGCVICDYNMPGSSGEDVLRSIKEKYADLPVIMLTGFVEINLAVKLMRMGAFDYMSKPVTRDHLLACVSRALRHGALVTENRRLEKENRSYQRQLEKKVIEQTFQISTQGEFVNRLNSLQNLCSAVNLVEHFTHELLGCDRFNLILRKEEGCDLQELYGSEGRDIQEFDISGDDEIFYKKLAQDRIIPVKPEGKDPVTRMISRDSCIEGGRTIAAALNLEGLPFGIMVLQFNDNGAGLNDKETQILRFVADSASIAVHNQLSRMKIEKGYLDTIKALAMAVEAKDPYTRGHSDRVRIYSELIGQRLTLPESEIKMLSFAGILHDIGKIGIPISVLHKASKLNDDEYRTIMKHPDIGETMISHIAFLKPAQKIIRHHHERFDGKGYPDRLKGEGICLGARIIAVADTFDAMTTDRPYRKAFKAEDALEELVRCANRQFDRTCVRAFLDLPLKEIMAQQPPSMDSLSAAV